MELILIRLLVTAVIVVLTRPLIGLLFGRAIGAAALAKQPDRIHLVPAGPSATSHADKFERAAETLIHEGFSDAGWFTVPELPGFVLRMLVNEAEGWHAVFYEHAQAGFWLELIMVFPDRSRFNFTSSRATGLAPLPNIQVTHLPGLSAEALLRHARDAKAKRPGAPLLVGVSGAAAAYEEGFAELMALRKARGISRTEVASVALRRGPGSRRAA